MKKTKAADTVERKAEVRPELRPAHEWAARHGTPRWLMAAASMAARVRDGAEFHAEPMTEDDFSAAIDRVR